MTRNRIQRKIYEQQEFADFSNKYSNAVEEITIKTKSGVRTRVDAMDINQSVDVLQKQVYNLQQNLKYLQQSGLPLYPSQGATVDLWQRSLERIR